jgi:protein-disulfide isomerase
MRKKGSFDANQPNEAALPAKETAGSRHPLIGCMKGTVTIPEGVDLTEPACPEWADVIDEKMPIQRAAKDTSS